jgi:O-antigen/teichoic acid export membrane protein
LSDLVPIVAPPREVVAEGGWLERATAVGIRFIPGLGSTVSNRLMIAVRGSAWTFIGYGAGQVLRLASTLILAHRLLAPGAFGLMALVTVFMSGLDVLSDLGIGMDVVQHARGDEPVFLDTAFSMQLIRGLVLWIVAIGVALPFASFYHQPQVRLLAIVGAFSIAIRGTASSSLWTMTRHVQLRKLTIINIASEGSGLVVAVLWALFSPTAWALVAGKIAAALALTIGSHIAAEHAATFRWDRSAARDLFIFGAGMLLSSGTYFLSGEAERLVVGKFITLRELGCFSLALSIAGIPLGVLQRIFSNVLFPMLSDSVRKDLGAAAEHFKRIRMMLLAASSIVAAGFIASSGIIVALLLRPDYSMTGWMLRLLGFRAGLELFGTGAATLLFALGNSKYAAIGNSVKLAFLTAGLAVAFSRFGFKEAVLVLAISPVAHYTVILIGLAIHFRSVLRSELVSFAVFLAISGIAFFLFR